MQAWILTGEPDLSTKVQVLREPHPDGGDGVPEHTVHICEEDDELRSDIAYYDAYHIRVSIGPAIGPIERWARRFPIEK